MSKFFILEVHDDGTAEYCRIREGDERFYVPEKTFGPWSEKSALGNILADIHVEVMAGRKN